MATSLYATIAVLVSVTLCYGKVYHAKCEIESSSGDPSVPLVGDLGLAYDDVKGKTTITGRLAGFKTDDNITEHGFHIHEHGKLGNQCKDAGGHYNPTNKTHGGPASAERHVGDLGNVKEDSSGEVQVNIEDSIVKLEGLNTVIGKAIVVHAKKDDFMSQPTGDAGGRLGCCVIEAASGGNRANFSFSSSLLVLATTYFLFLWQAN
uniref:Superoxide dismutase [Cu-Zn] n=1 Tax=Perinereis nuntia TaxID=460893 RepID=A0A096X912_PERNU|nr:Cu-Zn superoxide dismutase 1 [Perinereis nuntia]